MGHMKDLDRRIRQGGDDAIAAVSELMPQWIPSSEQSPPDRTLVMAYAAGRHVFGYTQGGDWIDTLYGWTLATPPTHWMPLPEPPG